MSPSDEELINDWLADMEKQKSIQKHFWEEEYPKLSLQERKMIWLRNLWQDVFAQGSAVGDDIFYMFTRENYQLWKSKYNDMDEILDFVLERIDSAHEGDGALIIEINNKLGRI